MEVQAKQQQVAVYMDKKEAELFLKFRQFEDIWEKLFAKNSKCSLKIDICEEKNDILFTFENKDKRELST
jgi:hypothetical protein